MSEAMLKSVDQTKYNVSDRVTPFGKLIHIWLVAHLGQYYKRTTLVV